MQITRIVKMTFRVDAIEIFQELFASKKQSIRNFPGCIHLELWQETNNPVVFFTYSRWSNELALETYRNSPFFGETWQATKILFAEKPQAWTVEVKVEN